MSRALTVMCGIALLAALWTMTFSTMPDPDKWAGHVWGFLWLVFAKVSTACFITAPVYREYLK